MKFEEQVKDLKVITITETRTFIQWTNTEEGRDKHDCYERINSGGEIFYVNKYGKKSFVHKNDVFFKLVFLWFNKG